MVYSIFIHVDAPSIKTHLASYDDVIFLRSFSYSQTPYSSFITINKLNNDELTEFIQNRTNEVTITMKSLASTDVIIFLLS